MNKLIIAIVATATLAGCAANPKLYSDQIAKEDKKYNTAECKEIRLKSLDYDDKVGERMAVGVVSGLLLGPFGLPFAAAADAKQNDERLAWNRQIHERCSSQPLPENLKPVAEQERTPQKNVMDNN